MINIFPKNYKQPFIDKRKGYNWLYSVFAPISKQYIHNFNANPQITIPKLKTKKSKKKKSRDTNVGVEKIIKYALIPKPKDKNFLEFFWTPEEIKTIRKNREITCYLDLLRLNKKITIKKMNIEQCESFIFAEAIEIITNAKREPSEENKNELINISTDNIILVFIAVIRFIKENKQYCENIILICIKNQNAIRINLLSGSPCYGRIKISSEKELIIWIRSKICHIFSIDSDSSYKNFKISALGCTYLKSYKTKAQTIDKDLILMQEPAYKQKPLEKIFIDLEKQDLDIINNEYIHEENNEEEFYS